MASTLQGAENQRAGKTIYVTKMCEFTPEEWRNLDGQVRQVITLHKEIAELKEKEKNAAAREAEAAKRGAEARNRKELAAEAKQHFQEAEKLNIEGSKMLLVSALTQMVFPQFDSKIPANRPSEIAQARQYIEQFSDVIVSSYLEDRWVSVLEKKCPHLNDYIMEQLVIPALSQLNAKSLTLDFKRFQDEFDIAPIADFIKTTEELEQVTFAEISPGQLNELAKAVSGCARANVIKFSNDATTAKFNEVLKAYQAIPTRSAATKKPLPVVPRKSLPVPTTPQKGNILQNLPPEGSPPKA